MTLEEYRNDLLPSQRPLFDEVIEIGIRKTIDALLDTDVDDLTLVRIVRDHWNLAEDVIEDILFSEKIKAAMYALERHLRGQHYSPAEIDDFMTDYQVERRLKREHELLSLHKHPEKIIKAVQPKKKK